MAILFTKNKRQKLGVFIWLLCAVLLVNLNFCTIQPIALRRTAAALSSIQEVVKQFAQEVGRLPASVTEIYQYCSQNKASCDFYDAFGNPIQYLRLGETFYIIRSFGEQGEPNNALYGKNLVRGKLPPLPAIAVQVKQRGDTQLSVYPAHYNDGVINQDGSWFARLYRDHNQRLSILILENKLDPNMFMVAREQKIEEFYWVSSTQIAYTQSGAFRSPDDIYLWDLVSGHTNRLLACSNSENTSPAFNHSTKMMLSLLGVDTTNKTLFALARKRDFEALSIAELYDSENIYSINVNTETNEFCTWKNASELGLDLKQKRSFPLSGNQPQRDYILSFDENGKMQKNAIEKVVDETLRNGCGSMNAHHLYEALLQQVQAKKDYRSILEAFSQCGAAPTYMHSITDKLRR